MLLAALTTLFVQQRNLKRENERLRSKQATSDLVLFAQGLQKQAETNYKAFLDAEASRQDLYVKYLALQDAYANFRAQVLNLTPREES